MENATLKPYADYKPSGIEWLGDVPAHWDSVPVKRIYSIQLGKMLQNLPSTSDDVEVPYLKAQHVQWSGVRVEDPPRMWASPRETHQFGVRVGDLLVCEGGEGGRCSLVKEVPTSYIIQNALHRVRETGKGHNAYLQFVLYTVAATGLFEAINDKATIAHFTREKFAALMIPHPPLDEQTAIVLHLDRADDRIRRAISVKERLIKLLTEQRQATIHRAVTRGLDPNVPLKDSGVEWLGDVPAHWESTAVKRHYEVQLGKMLQPSPNSPDDVEVPYLKAQHVHWNHIRIENAPTMWARHKEVKQFGIRQGDLLIVEGGAGATNSGILEKIPDGYIIQNALHRVRPKRQARNDFLLYMMMSVASSGWFEAINNKATIPHFTKEKLDGLPIPCPPLEEQAAIVRHLDKATSDIDTAIDKAQRQIDLLREYRTRLIADVVTGQVDVRGAVVG